MTPPDEPLSKMTGAMVPLHEMYLSMKQAGFSTLQACIILGTFLAQSTAQGGDRPDGA